MCQFDLSPTDRLERRRLSLGVRLSGLNVNYPRKLSSWRVKGMTVVAQRLCTAGRHRMERTPTTVWHRLFLRLILEVIFREPPPPILPSSPSLPPRAYTVRLPEENINIRHRLDSQHQHFEQFTQQLPLTCILSRRKATRMQARLVLPHIGRRIGLIKPLGLL